MVSIIDLGNSINARSAEVLARMVAFGEVAAGQEVTLQSESGNDVTIGSYQKMTVTREDSDTLSLKDSNGHLIASATLAAGKWTVDPVSTGAGLGANNFYSEAGSAILQQVLAGKINDDLTSNGSHHFLDVIAGALVAVDGSVQAGGMVELQYKIDSMLSSIQMSIKNGGQVAQTLQAAARG